MPAKLAIHVEKLSRLDLDEERERKRRLSERLQELRKNYVFCMGRRMFPNRILEMQAIKREGLSVKETLAAMQEYKPMLELAKRDPELLEAMVDKLILNLASFFNISQNIMQGQLREIAAMIIEGNKGLTLEDVAVCLHRMKKGVYGQVYGRLDGQVILLALDKYRQERQQRQASKQQALYLGNRGDYNSRTSQRIIEHYNKNKR